MKIAHRLFCKRSLAGEAIIVSIQIKKEKKPKNDIEIITESCIIQVIWKRSLNAVLSGESGGNETITWFSVVCLQSFIIDTLRDSSEKCKQGQT